MNRVFMYGIALFFAVVGIALLGGQTQAVAGLRGHGSHGVAACCGVDAGCAPAATCRGRCFGRLRERAASRCGGKRLFGHRRCAGRANDCCGEVVADCCGGAVMEGTPVEAAPVEAAPEAEINEAPADTGSEAPVAEGA